MPSSESFAETSAICGHCHDTVHQENVVTLSMHANEKVGCLECHQVHGNKDERLLKMAQPQLCYTCHGEIEGQFAKPYRHAVAEGIMDCSDCHLMADDEMAQLERFGKNGACFKCHAEFQGPFPYDHQAAVDYSTEEGGCINCHDPHGSYLPRMMIQPYEAPVFQLCSQCHVVPQHKENSQHGKEWDGVSCSECHVDIHGSYTSQYYYPPTLAAQGCFIGGCHSQ
jgi:DmsE family decaheme c-type cytochrome